MEYAKAINEYPDFLTAREISSILRIGYTKSLNFIKYSGIPYIKIGNTYRISKTDFISWADAKENKIVEVV